MKSLLLKDLVPWRLGKGSVPVRHEEGERNPITALQREVNDVFNGFFGGFAMDPLWGWGQAAGFNPNINVVETDTEIKVTAELPGMDEQDIDISLTKDTLTLKGEKREEKEDKGKGYYHVERSYGSFARTIPLMCDIDDDKAEAEFKKGILTIKLPKTAEAVTAAKKVPVKSG